MVAEKDEFDALSKEIMKMISDNLKFLSRVMDEDFEPEEEVEDNEVIEEL
jgi:hypothetical protein